MNYFNFLNRQENPAFRGEACLQAIFEFYGAKVKLEDVIVLTGNTGIREVTFSDLQRVAKHLGFSTNYLRSSVHSLITYNKPAILRLVQPETLQCYFSVFFEFHAGGIVMGNVDTGLVQYISERELSYIWLHTQCLYLYP